jgi:hypothetical protein
MSNVKLSYATPVVLTLTSANLASSVTAGWMSQSIDNTANLYLDAFVQINLARVNTAPAGTKALYLYAYGTAALSGTVFTTTAAANTTGTITGTVGTVTFPSVTTLPVGVPLLGIVPYPIQDSLIISPNFSIAKAFGGTLPPIYGIAMINDTGMTLSVTSITVTPVFMTVT